MRDPKRLDKFYDELKELHKKYLPDWRYGQLMSNFINWMTWSKNKDIFFPEEDDMMHYMKSFISYITGEEL